MSGGAETTQTTQSQAVNQLPPWINQAAQQNYALAQNISNRPLQQYQGQLVADVAPQTQQAFNAAAQGGQAGQEQYNAANAGLLGVMGQAPQQVTAGQLSNTNLQPYMNPYTQNVINQTLPIMQQNLGLQQNQQQNAANSANAFGGSRQAVQQGVTQAQGAMGMGQMAAQLNQANFGQAQAAAQQDIAGRYTAAAANQAAQQNQAGLNLQAASQLGSLGQQAQRNQLQQFGELTTAGGLEQQQAQNQINAQLGKFQQAWGYPGQQLGVLQSALSQTPYETATQGQTVQQTQQSPDIMNQISGGLGMLGSIFAAPATGGTSLFAGLQGAAKTFGGAARGTSHVGRGRVRPPSGADKIPMLLSPGEAVLNPHAAALAGRGNIDRLNRAGLAAAGRPMAFGPPGGAGPPGVAPAGLGRGPPGMAPAGFGRGPPVPGPLAAPGAMGAIGALGAPMRGAPRMRPRRPKGMPIRGALTGV